ncbi:MAG: hypothetical protein NWR72_13970 [Bacteroidia bacterium]|nr:hypothetical protein [Bacteroidia bacterium]
MKLVKIAFLFLSLFPFVLSAQSVGSAEESVYALTDAGFLDLYKDYRAETEMYVALFKANIDQYSPEDVVRMRSTYRRTSEAFEDFIYSIRNDFLDRKVRKTIKKDCEGYVTRKLEELNGTYLEYYLTRFQPTYAMIAEGKSPDAMVSGVNRMMAPGIPVALIAPLATATMQAVDFFDKKGDRDLLTLKEVLEKEWIKPHKFRDWDDI